jgi:hypothetical protein
MVEEMVEMDEDIAVEASRAEDITEGKRRAGGAFWQRGWCGGIKWN